LETSGHQTKIGIIFGLLLIPIVLFGTLFVQQSRKDIAFAQAERLGLETLRTVLPELMMLTSHGQDQSSLRGLLSENTLRGIPNTVPLNAAPLTVLADPFHPAISAEFSLSSQVQEIKLAMRGGESTKELAIDRLMNLVSLIGDQSNLILDPDLDSYYLMDVVVLRVPAILHAMHEIRSGANIQRKSSLALAPHLQTQAFAAFGRFASARAGMNHALARVYRADISGVTQSRLARYGTEIDQQLRAVEDKARPAILGQSGPVAKTPIDHTELDRDISTMHLAIGVFWQNAVAQLDLLLVRRIEGFEQRLYTALTISGMVALLALLLAIRLFRSMLSRLDDTILFLAEHDHLTGLENRASITSIIDRALADKGTGNAVHLIDLDRFKSINDSRGHAAGDEVIKVMGSRLLALCNRKHAVGRLGGDEFVVLQRNVAHAQDVSAFAERMVAAMRRPFEIGGDIVHATASVGSAMAPRHGLDQSKLLICADLALYAAKDAGRNRAQFYTETLEAASKERARIEQELRNAVIEKRFDIEFQPQYSVSGEQLRGFEALVRLKDSAGLPISPGIFIPIAEQMGLIGQISDQVMHQSCSLAALWPPNLSLAINLSPLQFIDGELPERIYSTLEKSGMAPERLTVEITEGLLLEKTPQVQNQLEALRDMGVGIAIDDFGSGYSSLAYLSQFRFTKIKIDRSFVIALSSGQQSAQDIIRTIITLGRAMRMTVIAEGVETPEQAEVMRELGCDEIQGYVYGRPVPATDTAAIILAHGQKRLTLAPPALLIAPSQPMRSDDQDIALAG
jgi:diguanylate cyclase (GGDEF)-like protein